MVSVCTFLPQTLVSGKVDSIWGSSGGSEGHLEGTQAGSLGQGGHQCTAEQPPLHWEETSHSQGQRETKLGPYWVPPRISVAGWMEVCLV